MKFKRLQDISAAMPAVVKHGQDHNLSSYKLLLIVSAHSAGAELEGTGLHPKPCLILFSMHFNGACYVLS